jgi:hypothetical protein
MKLEDDHNFFENGRLTNLFRKWKTTSIFLVKWKTTSISRKIEDDLCCGGQCSRVCIPVREQYRKRDEYLLRGSHKSS